MLKATLSARNCPIVNPFFIFYPFFELSFIYMDKTMNNIWRIWAKALGEKSGKSDDESDKIAIIRTVIVLSYIITNLFIIAGVIKHWN
jgi:hypothetical protein